MSDNDANEDENKLIAERRRKLAAWREAGEAFPNDFRRDALAAELHERFAEASVEELEAAPQRFRLAGRIMAKRVMGKASFAHIQDMSGQIQLFLKRDELADGDYEAFKDWDIGDLVGADGTMFRTKKGELSLRCDHVRLLTKALRPLPEKYHGLTDTEARYRQRYVDLIMNPSSRETFVQRSRIVRYIRDYFNADGFLEVETPMMQPIPGGASARPFVTHHNALDTDLYLRIAPELYLKRLVVGGLERVYEINRNFRNEGVSTRHNPEFTMLEYYQAYADYNELMDRTESLLRGLCQEVLGTSVIHYQGEDVDFGQPFRRITVRDALLKHYPALSGATLDDHASVLRFAQGEGIEADESWGLGQIWMALFEAEVEQSFRRPTFVTDYPKEVSPLARPRDDDPFVTERFELIVGGREIANGFSELNDPEDQAARFREQVAEKEAGDDEAMFYDEDFIRALEYGLPPTAGEGIGIDRLVMLLTDAPSIRDVLLFPAMRPQARSD
jgi:lysyl-tRNA synthetase class 2